MGIAQLVAKQKAEETLDEAKARVESEVATALGEGFGIVEINITYAHHAALVAWVESEGMRCGCNVSPGREAVLVVNMTMEPPPPKSAEQIAAEIDAVLARQIETNALVDRVAQLEALVASLGGA
jgi:hypothetical protein